MDGSTPDGRYEEFVELFTSNERSLRSFVRTLVPSWHDADEIVQEVALVAWRKFDEFESGTSFLPWVCMIARFKSMAFRRKMARDRLCFNEDLIDLMADEGAEEANARQDEYEALEKCLRKLTEKQQKLIQVAYTPGESIKREAEAAGIRPGTVYMQLNRIRATLFQCIGKTLAEEGGV